MTHNAQHAIEIALLALVAVMSIRVADRELRTFTYAGGVYIAETRFIDAVRLAALCRRDSSQADSAVVVTLEAERLRLAQPDAGYYIDTMTLDIRRVR